MAELGKLCHKHGGNALCHKSGGDALVYKSQPPEDAVVYVDIGPVDWHCLTYGVDHTAKVSCRAWFTSGSGTFTLDESSGGTHQTWTIHPKRGSSAEFTFYLGVTSTGCAGPEDPGVHADLIAFQGSFSDTAGVTLPVSSEATAVAVFDASGHLTGLR